MKTRFLLKVPVFLLCLLGFGKVFAKPTITVSTNITSNTHWDSSNNYLLSGYIYVKNGATLTIDPGTVIMGAAAPKLGALIITAGSKIIADGTLEHPIVFTSSKLPASRNRGDWGGLIILGYGPHNLGGAQVEGIVPNEDTKFGPLAAARDGKSTNPHDNSGILRYVRVEFAGYALSPNNEINGITFGAVGDGTTIDYVQVSYANDDSFEWFGGTVNCKHLIAFRGIDDDFDTDNGYSGKCQFLVSLRDPNVADQSGSKGFESDNNADGTVAFPQTKAVFANTDVIGGGDTTNSALYTAGAHIRRNSAMVSINNIVLGWPEGLRIDGAPTNAIALTDTLVINNLVTVKSGVATKYVNSTTNNTAVRNLLLAVNQFGTGNSFVKLTAPYTLNSPNFLPAVGSPALGAAQWNHKAFIDSTTGEIDAFWDTTGVNYIGAFGSFDWTAGWANFNPTASDAPTVDPAAVCTKKGTTPTISKAIFINDVCKTGRISITGVGGKAAAGEVYKYTWGKLVYAADNKTVIDTTILYTDTTAGSLTELSAGTYVAKVKLGTCSTKFVKVAKLVKYSPRIAGFTAGTDSINVKVSLGKLYTAMSGYAYLIRYADSANAALGKWSIWSGSTNQNTYYDGKGKDGEPNSVAYPGGVAPFFGPLWRDIDTTKLPTITNIGTGTGVDYNGNTITNIGWMTPANETFVRFKNSQLRANGAASPYSGNTIKVAITPATKYVFQLIGRCFTSTGAVVYSNVVSSPRYDSTSTVSGKVVKMYATKTPKPVKTSFAANTVATADAAFAGRKEMKDAVVYPNPTRGIVKVNLNGFNGSVSIRVTNSKGQVVFASKENSFSASSKTIDLSAKSSGAYYVEINDGVKKIVKQVIIAK